MDDAKSVLSLGVLKMTNLWLGFILSSYSILGGGQGQGQGDPYLTMYLWRETSLIWFDPIFSGEKCRPTVENV